jgi:hypothetical protein
MERVDPTATFGGIILGSLAGEDEDDVDVDDKGVGGGEGR